MLARRAAKLFAHVKEVVQAAKLGSAIGADYAGVLRSNLLSVPAYCAAVPASTFQGVLCLFFAPSQRCQPG